VAEIDGDGHGFGPRNVGDDHRARRAGHMRRRKDVTFKITVRIPQDQTHRRIGALVAKKYFMTENVDADRRFIFRIETIENKSLGQRGFSYAG